MPRTRSAKKALRQNARRRVKNLSRSARMRKVIKEYRKLTASGADAAKLGLALREAQQILGKMAKVGLVKRGKARRLTSRLARKIPRG